MTDLSNIKIPTIEEERDRLLSLIDNKYYKSQGSIFYDVMSVIAEDNIKMYSRFTDIFKNAFGLTAEGKYLDLKVSEVGLERKVGIKAKGNVKFKGEIGTKIPFNTVVVCDTLQYVTLFDTVIDNSDGVNIEVEAVEVGTKYNVLANSITKLGIPISNVSEVTNEVAFTNGTDTESDAELRKRYFEKVREQATSGNAYHYKQWAISVDGIGQAKVYPLWRGAGTVKVIVIGSNGRNVNQDKIDEVKSYIDDRRPIGATVTVENARTKNIELSVRISKNPLVDISLIKNQLIEEINGYLADVNIKSSSIYYGKISAIMYGINGVLDYSNLRINNNTDSISLEDDEIAVLGEVTVNV